MGVKNYIQYLLILLIAFIPYILLVFRLSRPLFVFELFMVIFLILLSLLMLWGIYHDKKYGQGMAAVIFVILLLNLLLIKLTLADYLIVFALGFFFGAIGFIKAIIHLSTPEEVQTQIEEFEEEKPETQVELEVYKTPEKYVKSMYEPGKYVASKQGKVYHTPKCDWVKNIRRSNRVWFRDDQEARKKGYKKHSCLR